MSSRARVSTSNAGPIEAADPTAESNIEKAWKAARDKIVSDYGNNASKHSQDHYRELACVIETGCRLRVKQTDIPFQTSCRAKILRSLRLKEKAQFLAEMDAEGSQKVKPCLRT